MSFNGTHPCKRLVDAGNGEVIIPELFLAECFFRRLRGLLGYSVLGSGQGLLIRPCHAVHTFGMRYPLHLTWLDKNMQVIRMDRCLPPMRTASCRGAVAVIEQFADPLDSHALPQVGQFLHIEQGG
jgi:uncharacterized membrane protein (UPF0127 family)